MQRARSLPTHTTMSPLICLLQGLGSLLAHHPTANRAEYSTNVGLRNKAQGNAKRSTAREAHTNRQQIRARQPKAGLDVASHTGVPLESDEVASQAHPMCEGSKGTVSVLPHTYGAPSGSDRVASQAHQMCEESIGTVSVLPRTLGRRGEATESHLKRTRRARNREGRSQCCLEHWGTEG